MNEQATIQLEVPLALLGNFDRLAAMFGAERDHLILTALHRFIADEDEGGGLEADDRLDTLLKEGLDDLDSGRSVSHEEVVRRVSERLRRAA